MARGCMITLIVLTVLGVALVAVGTALIFVFKNTIRQTIEKNVVLKNGSEAYKAWNQPPAPIYMQFWMFNVSNTWQIIERGDKPKVTQHGPYTYREIRTKEDIEFVENGTEISYRESKAYVFMRNMSAGSENDSFTLVNLPILTIADKLQRSKVPGFVLKILAAILSRENERLFEAHTVHEFLWGYTEKTLEKINKITQQYLKYSFNTTVGLFIGKTKNGSDDGLYSIYSGVGDVQKLNEIHTWKGKRYLPYWSTPYCNQINGTDGSMWHPFVNTSERLYIFSSDVCRSIYVDYNASVSVYGIPVYHFVPPPSVFKDHKENPDNIGFCVPNCLKSGVLDVSKCKGAPIIVSQPHFYQGSSDYINAIDGMNPDSMYSTYMDVEPYTGKALRVAKKLQLSAKITKLDMFKDTAMFNFTIFPFLWLNESAAANKHDAGKFSKEVMRPIKILEGVQYGLIVIGGVILLCVLIYVIQMVIRKKKDDDVSLLDADNAPRGDI